MATTFPIGPQTFPTGDTLIPARSIPTGLHGATLTLDVGSIIAPQVLHFHVEYFDGTDWSGGFADFTGPWVDRQGVTHTDSSLSLGFGTVPDGNGGLVPRASAAGWQVRATITAEHGPITSNGGSLAVF